jgi:hypothetical protein
MRQAISAKGADDDSDYDPSADAQSYDSDEDSNYQPSVPDGQGSDEDDADGHARHPIDPLAGDAGDMHNAGVDNEEHEANEGEKVGVY